MKKAPPLFSLIIVKKAKEIKSLPYRCPICKLANKGYKTWWKEVIYPKQDGGSENDYITEIKCHRCSKVKTCQSCGQITSNHKPELKIPGNFCNKCGKGYPIKVVDFSGKMTKNGKKTSPYLL